MRVAYFFARRQFGKVATPLTVFCARMPFGFTAFYGKISQLDKKLQLPVQTTQLIRERVANLNRCLFCMDIGRWFTMKDAPENLSRLDALSEYQTSPSFSDAERAALDYATELTTQKRVEPETYARLAQHYSEREICDVVWLVASEHLYNISNIALNIGSDGLCDLRTHRNTR
jgi:alkylhydroperoxidase family enzyme